MRLPKFRCKNKTGNWCFFTILHDGNVNEENFGLETLSQFTGLSDKQGVEIYEGDILSRSFMDDYPNQKSYVCFEDCGYKLKVKNGGNRPMSDRAGWCELRRYGEIEVIGNIYEHPHLLGGE